MWSSGHEIRDERGRRIWHLPGQELAVDAGGWAIATVPRPWWNPWASTRKRVKVVPHSDIPPGHFIGATMDGKAVLFDSPKTLWGSLNELVKLPQSPPE